jgi:hypothetical protein|tara:strand:+ start:3834 stop:5612 length:1779 start_codon:yes stop_codon:yes gene_type:complete
MSGFAGYLERAGGAVSATERAHLDAGLAGLSRDSRDTIRTLRAGRVALAGYILTPGSAHLELGGDTATMIVGDPVYCESDDSAAASPADGFARLAECLAGQGDAALLRTRGEFVAVSLRADGSLRLASSHCGTRPLHIYQDDDLVAFATNQRTLAAMLPTRLRMDPIFAAEILTTGTRSCRGTPFADTIRLRDAETVTVDDAGLRRRRWFDWADLQIADRSYDDTLDLIERRFLNAVRRRLRNTDARTYAALSGGLDSRMVVTALRKLGVPVRTLALGGPGFADNELSKLAAQALSTDHHIFAVDAGHALTYAPFSGLVAANMPRDPGDEAAPLWFGDGGSVMCGHVYMDTQSIDHFATASPEARAEEMMKETEETANLLDASTRDRNLAGLARRLREEYQDADRAPPDNRQRLYLLRTDQQWHADGWFEHIDIFRSAECMPFFDADYIRAVMESPPAHFLMHRLQNDLLNRLDPAAYNVPWQVYPGHLPGPAPLPEGLRKQWDSGVRARDMFRQAWRENLDALAASPRRDIRRPIARTRLALARILVRTPLYHRFFIERLALYARFLRIVPFTRATISFGPEIPHEHYPPN